MSNAIQTILGVLLMLLVVSSPARGSVDGAKPNIVIFLVDDMGPMDTSVPMLTDKAGRPERHPLNNWYRTNRHTRVMP